MSPDEPLPLLVYPDPRLSVVSKPFTNEEFDTGTFTFDSLSKDLTIDTPNVRIDTQQLVYDMKKTADFYNAAGLAASQVGVFKRMMLVTIDEPITMFNPRVVSEDGQQTHEEGCLSIPNFSARITRPQQTTVEYENIDGETKQLFLVGLSAAAIKHEIEHLDGKLFIDNLDSLSSLKINRIRNKVTKYLKQNFYPTL